LHLLCEFKLDDPQIHANYKKIDDVERRIFEYKKYYVNKDICDVGCGSGLFLQSAMINAKSVSGVEIQENYLDLLNSNKITSFKSIQKHSKAFDTVFMFHTLEHISDPMSLLKSVKNSLQKSNGKVVIEVPHANDFLISSLADQQFIDFTLWSKHLVLHTRNSLRLMLEAAGFSNVIIQGVQRFPLSNTLTWLSKSKPGGHETNLSMIDSPELHNAYENCLRKIDETDTLVAVASI